MTNSDDGDCQRTGFIRFVSRLSWVTGVFDASPFPRTPEPRPPALSPTGSTRPAEMCARPRPFRPGFLVHSLLGKGVREIAREEEPPCAGPSESPGECLYARLFEPRPAKRDSPGTPLGGVERLPGPVSVDAPWRLADERTGFRFRLNLLGRAALLRSAVSDGAARGFAGGVAATRSPWRLSVVCWQSHTGQDVVARVLRPGRTSLASGRKTITLHFRSPLRLVRNKVPLFEFDPSSLLRDIAFRLGVWGHYHQGLEWPEPWRFLAEDLAGVTVTRTELRWQGARRYSARQQREIPLGGLVGFVDLSDVSAPLRVLLHMAEITGAGKGTSSGLGRLQVEEGDPRKAWS